MPTYYTQGIFDIVHDFQFSCQIFINTNNYFFLIEGVPTKPLRQAPPGDSHGMPLSFIPGIFSATTAWNLKRLRQHGLNGAGTVIAILDTAISNEYCLLYQKNTGRVIDQVSNYLPEIKTPVVRTEHGTVCASVAGGPPFTYNNELSVPCGVAPEAQLIVYRVAEGDTFYNAAVFGALNDIKTKMDNGLQHFDVVSMSFELEEDDTKTIKKIEDLICYLTTVKGVIFVAAAGNRGNFETQASLPARWETVISVGALDKNGCRADFNARGQIDVFAPGEDISGPSGKPCFGTSFATPAVSGLVALLKQLATCIPRHADAKLFSDVKTIKRIFNKAMIFKSDDEKVDVFQPVRYFLHVIDNPTDLLTGPQSAEDMDT